MIKPSVTLRLSATEEQQLGVPERRPDAETARQWLDAQFVTLDCDIPRASGKVLVKDKLLAIAEAAGPARLADAAWSGAFAAAAAVVMGRDAVTIDLVQRQVH